MFQHTVNSKLFEKNMTFLILNFKMYIFLKPNKSFEEIKKTLIDACQNLEEAQRMIDFVLQHDENQFSSSKLDGYLQNAHPSFHLFEEQDSDPELLITATRFYTDQRGRNAFFFNSSRIKQVISKCRNSVEKYYNNHLVSLKMHRNYDILDNFMNGHFSFYNDGIDRGSIVCCCFILTLGIAYGIDQSLFSPKMQFLVICF